MVVGFVYANTKGLMYANDAGKIRRYYFLPISRSLARCLTMDFDS